jgi:hypothetical protein
MPAPTDLTPERALDVLRRLGASAWLVRHHELVLEAASELCAALAQLFPTLRIERDLVLAGAALHDAGKIAVPDEMHGPGHRHEALGEALLREHGIAGRVASFCITHATWNDPDCSLTDRLVALADKLWKGKRDAALEARVLDDIVAATATPTWQTFDKLDAICEQVASKGPERLARSNV